MKGVVGIGEKGATALLQKYGNLDAIYENINTLELKPSQCWRSTPRVTPAGSPHAHHAPHRCAGAADEILTPRVPLDVPP